MTSIEWLDEQLQEYVIAVDHIANTMVIKISFEEYMDFKRQAKEMHRIEHGKTWDAALDKYEVRAGNYMRAYEDFDDYYEQLKQNNDSKTNA